MTLSKKETSQLDLPVDHISAISMIKFSTNPILYKIQYINRESFDNTTNIAAVMGKAFHSAMEVFYGKHHETIEEAIKAGLEELTAYLEEYNDGWINFSKTIDTKQKALEKVVFGYNSYVQYMSDKERQRTLECEWLIEEQIDIEYKGQRLYLPIPLKGILDKVVEDEKGRLVIKDYKTCSSFSDPEKIDGAKILQSIEYYFLAYAATGKEPYSMVYEEVKLSKNRDGSPQVREYEIVYKDNELYFDFYLRFYEDMIKALNGQQVYVPNIHSFFDNEVAIVAYIQRLDEPEEAAKIMEANQVDNITDALRKELARTSDMKTLMKTIENQFSEAKAINYSNMKPEEKIKTKLMEHGTLLRYEDVIEGATIDLYRFTPTTGVKMKKIKSYVDDLEQVLGKSGVRILAPIPNSTMVGVEVPKDERVFPERPETQGFDLAIGQNIIGEPLLFDIREAPHMLVAGATGSGKSVFLGSLIEQLAMNPRVDLHLFDPKRVEMSMYKHYAKEYENDPDAIFEALSGLAVEMERRYKYMEEKGVRGISELPRMRYKVIVIDEFGELTLTSDKKKEFSDLVLRLTQLARAAGIHLIISTQRPSTDIIKGTIKNNVPTRVCMRVGQAVDSRVVLDEAGAEKLLGKGDMLFLTHTGVERLQGYKN